MRLKLLAVLTSFGILGAACAGTAVDNAPDASDITSSTVPSGDAAEDPSSGGDSDSTDGTTPPDGEPARDFTLALGADQSEQFVLSQEVKPVFMVFWAEW